MLSTHFHQRDFFTAAVRDAPLLARLNARSLKRWRSVSVLCQIRSTPCSRRSSLAWGMARNPSLPHIRWKKTAATTCVTPNTEHRPFPVKAKGGASWLAARIRQNASNTSENRKSDCLEPSPGCDFTPKRSFCAFSAQQDDTQILRVRAALVLKHWLCRAVYTLGGVHQTLVQQGGTICKRSPREDATT